MRSCCVCAALQCVLISAWTFFFILQTGFKNFRSGQKARELPGALPEQIGSWELLEKKPKLKENQGKRLWAVKGPGSGKFY